MCGRLLGEVKIATGTRKASTFNGTQMKRPPSGGNLELDFSRNIEVCSFVKVSEVAFAMSRQPTRMADSKKVSGELFSLTYGALVAQIVKVDSHHLDWSMVQWYYIHISSPGLRECRRRESATGAYGLQHWCENHWGLLSQDRIQQVQWFQGHFREGET